MRRRFATLLVLLLLVASAQVSRAEKVADSWSELDLPAGFQRGAPWFEIVLRGMVKKMVIPGGAAVEGQAMAFSRKAASGEEDLIALAFAPGRSQVLPENQEFLVAYRKGMEKTSPPSYRVDRVTTRWLLDSVPIVESAVSGPDRLQQRMALIPRREVTILIAFWAHGVSAAECDAAWDRLLATFRTKASEEQSRPSGNAASNPNEVDWLKLALSILVLVGFAFLVRGVARTVARWGKPV